MIVLLPPSEGKAAPEIGPALDLSALSNSVLTPAREQVLSSLIRLCRRTPRQARIALGLSAAQRPEVATNAELRSAPCAPAWQVYSGVLFAALGYRDLPPELQDRASQRLLITSALFGIVTPNDPIPAYRLSGSTSLLKLGRLDTFWRNHLGPAIAPTAADGLIIDMRSGTYVKFWPIPQACADRALTVKIWQYGPDGQRTAVSHHNKDTKGHVARTLATAPTVPQHRHDVVDLLRGENWDARLVEDPKLPHDRLDITID